MNDLFYLTRINTEKIPEDANIYTDNVNEKVLIQLASNEVHQLLEEFRKLEREQIDGDFVRVLPERKTLLQREKHLPKQKELTTWEKFAIKKGIRKSKDKKQRLVFDEETGQYMSKYQLKKLQRKRSRQ